jgi:signal transduction histidine kinase/ActR/RegA family two-component response regulator
MTSWSAHLERWRSLPVVAGAAAGLVLLTGIGISLYNEHIYQAQRVRQSAAEAKIVAASVSAAVAFNDESAIQQYLNALRDNPEIDAAGVYDDHGRLVASYVKSGSRPLPTTRPQPGPVEQSARVFVNLPVTEKGHALGAVYLRTVADLPIAVLTRHAGVALLIIVTSLLIGLMGAAQLVLRQAIAELQSRARDLASANRELMVHMAERERVEEALRQSQKMEAIGQLTGGIAHDFNNILMVASSGLDLMDRTSDPARRQVLKDGIRQAVERGAGLTRQLLAISRRSALQPQVIDLLTQIEGMRVLLDRSLREDISIELRLAPDLWPVEVDRSQLEVALLNVAVNARDAMPGGGEITITGENVTGVPGERLRGDYVRLSIGDQGTGMSRAVLDRIFEPFFTTKGVGKGTGLGLAQVYGFVRASGGEIRVESAEGRGTTVRLYLPRTDKAVRDPLSGADTAVEAVRTCDLGSVLLVEDDEAVAALVGDMLRDLGYEVVHVQSAASALELLAGGRSIDFVFSDMVMPGRMNGMELAREIGRKWPQIPVLLTTGFSEAAESASRAGLSLLMKPYRIEALAAALSTARAGRAA